MTIVNDKIGEDEVYTAYRVGKFKDWDLICQPNGYCGNQEKIRQEKAKRRLKEKKSKTDSEKAVKKQEPKEKNIAIHTFLEKAADDYSELMDVKSENNYPPARNKDEITRPRPYHEWVNLFQHFTFFWEEYRIFLYCSVVVGRLWEKRAIEIRE